MVCSVYRTKIENRARGDRRSSVIVYAPVLWVYAGHVYAGHAHTLHIMLPSGDRREARRRAHSSVLPLRCEACWAARAALTCTHHPSPIHLVPT
jgi:hypothetical protein